MEAFEPVRLLLIRGIPSCPLTNHKTPSNKSMGDHFIGLDEGLRNAVRENEAYSRNLKVVTDLEVLVDDLIHERDE